MLIQTEFGNLAFDYIKKCFVIMLSSSSILKKLIRQFLFMDNYIFVGAMVYDFMPP